MIRCVVLASGSGTKLQSLLDSIFFGEIPDMEIVAVISSDPEANALTRARNAHIEAVDIHREVFPNESTFDLAVRNKIRDLDADLVIDAGFHPTSCWARKLWSRTPCVPRAAQKTRPHAQASTPRKVTIKIQS